MDLPNLFSSAPKKDKLFLGLVLTEHSVQAVLWKIATGSISVIKKSNVFPIENKDQASVQTDQALQELEELSENLSEVLLGLESSWVNEKGIIDSKKPFLKKLTEDLSLKPIGFVVITEAVTQYLAETDPQLNAVLVFYTSGKITVSLIENGTLQKTESVGRSDDSVSDLTEALARFHSSKKKKLPPTVKLVSISLTDDELYEQQQATMSGKWEESGYFVRMPTIETLPEKVLVDSVITEGGRAVAKSQGIDVTSPSHDDVNETEAEEFAFKEVAVDDSKEEEEKINPEDDNLAVPESTQTSFGIPISSSQLPKVDESVKKPTDNKPDSPPKNKKDSQSRRTNPFFKWLNSHKKIAIVAFLAGLVTLFILATVGASATGRASIQLSLDTQNINKDISITLDPNISESDFSDLIIKSELVSKEFSLEQTNETTGVTLVGEKATGKVEIWNKTNSEKSFPAGTNLSSGDLRFTLDDDVTVASASSEEKGGQEVKTFGKEEVSVTAVKIGAEANLNSDTKLNIADFSTGTYEAVALESFSGGSSREIRVVSEEDQSKLFNEVRNQILDLAETEYADDSTNEQTFISTGNFDVVEQAYSAEVGDEVRTITLSLTATVEAISYQTADVKPLAESVLGELVPEGFKLADKEPQILSDVSSDVASGSAITIDANISTNAIADINLDELKSQLVGKNLGDAERILKDKSEIKAFTINLNPRILERLWKKLPNNLNRIELNVE